MLLKLFAIWSINFTTAWLCACGGIVANDQGFVSGGEIDFRLPRTAADWKYFVEVKN